MEGLIPDNTTGRLIMKRGKKYTEAAKLIDKTALYTVADALDQLVDIDNRGYSETNATQVITNVFEIERIHGCVGQLLNGMINSSLPQQTKNAQASKKEEGDGTRGHIGTRPLLVGGQTRNNQRGIR